MRRVATLSSHLGDTVRFRVDGKVVEGRVAQMIAPGKIASVSVDHGDSGTSWINVTTSRDGEAQTNLVPYKSLEVHPESGWKADAFRVMENVHESIGLNVLHRTAATEKEGFHGLLFINGKRADPSELEKLDHMELKSVEVVKGPEARKVYGDPAASFGVIKVITK